MNPGKNNPQDGAVGTSVERPVSVSSSPALAYLALIMAGSLWGTGFFFGKIALREMGVGDLVFYRFLFACTVLLPVVIPRHKMVRRRDVATFVIAGIIGVPVQFLLQFQGLAQTTVSHASVVVGTLPVMIAVAASWFAHERLERRDWLALASSTAGVMLIVLGARHEAAAGATVAGDLLVVLSMISAVAWILLSQRLVRRYSAVVATAYVYFIGFVALAGWVFSRAGLPPTHLSWKAWGAVAAMGVLCTATTTLLWNWALHKVPASRSGIFLNLEPLVGALLGIAVLGDPFGWPIVAGGALILTGAAYFSSKTH